MAGASPDGLPTKKHVGIQMTALGLEFGASAVGGLFAGWWLDEQLGTAPWLLVICTFAGVLTSFVRIIQLSRQFERAHAREEEPRPGEDS